MKFLSKKIVTILAILLILIAPVLSLAQEPDVNPGSLPTKLENPIGNITTVQAFIGKLLNGAIKLGIPLVALAIIYSGFLFVKAQGKSEEITAAKDALLYSLIGGAILLGAWAISQALLDTVKLLAN